MPLLLSICTRRLFSKLKDFKSRVAAITTPEIPRSCGHEAFGHRYCHWVHHLCDTIDVTLASLCLVWYCYVFVGQGYAKPFVLWLHIWLHTGDSHLLVTSMEDTALSLDGGQPWMGHMGCWKTLDHSIQNNRIPSVTFKREAISKKTPFWAMASFLHSFH